MVLSPTSGLQVWKKVDQVIGVFKQQPNRDAVPEPAAPPAAPPPRGPLHRAAAQLPPAPPPPPPAAAWGNVQPAAVPGGSWGAAQQPQAVQDGGWGAVVQPPLPPQQPQYGQQQQQWQPAPGYPRHPPQPPVRPFDVWRLQLFCQLCNLLILVNQEFSSTMFVFLGCRVTEHTSGWRTMAGRAMHA